jgi:hypothetical protein
MSIYADNTGSTVNVLCLLKFNYSSRLTPSTLSPTHRMSIYFPRPLYEPEEISLSLASTLTLRHHDFVNIHTESRELDYETYYKPDSGGEEVLVDFDVPLKTPQTMDFIFPKGSMSLSHFLRVQPKVTLFPDDGSKRSSKTVFPARCTSSKLSGLSICLSRLKDNIISFYPYHRLYPPHRQPLNRQA